MTRGAIGRMSISRSSTPDDSLGGRLVGAAPGGGLAEASAHVRIQAQLRQVRRRRARTGRLSHWVPGCLWMLMVLSTGPSDGAEQPAPFKDQSREASPKLVSPMETAAACPVAESEDGQLEADLFRLVNWFRANGAQCGVKGRFSSAPPLGRLDELDCAARAQARNMAEWGFFSHVNPHGEGPQARAHAHGFRGPVRENLAWGQQTAANVVATWLASPDHCAALMSLRYRHTGVGYRKGPAGKPLWVQVFGS